jgi:hypothetical protein
VIGVSKFYPNGQIGWRGRPVQWVGLVFAKALQRLADHSTVFPWRKMAIGLATAGLQWQNRSGKDYPELVGTFTDVLNVMDDTIIPALINPDLIIKNSFLALGYSDGIDAMVIGTGSGRPIHIATSAKLTAANLDSEGNLHITVRPAGDQTVCIAITDRSGSVKAVSVNGTSVKSAGSDAGNLKDEQHFAQAQTGWYQVPQDGRLYLKSRPGTSN